MKRCRSDGAPRLGEGGVEGSALRAALGGPTRLASPFRLHEVFDAADRIAEERSMRREFARIGFALDLMCGGRRVSRYRMSRALRIGVELVEVYELIWESLDPNIRFELARQAVRFIHANRIAVRRERK